MHASASDSGRALGASVFLCLVFLLLGGCADKSHVANIDLRKQIQTLEAEKAEQARVHAGDLATIKSLQDQRGTVARLPQEQVEKLFTTHGLSLRRLTGADSQGVHVYITPTDDAGDRFKAAGSFVIEAFDPSNVRVDRWEFSIDQARAAWHGDALLYEFVLDCPWTKPTTLSEVKVKIAFTDGLTHREVSAETTLKVTADVKPTTVP